MNGSEYINYFGFLKNLKNQPDTGLSPLVEWQLAVEFFSKTIVYLDLEWFIDIDKILSYQGCTFDEYAIIFRHRQKLSEIVIRDFYNRKSVNNAALSVLKYLENNGFYSQPKEN